jgi:hypothetical protein
VRIRYGPDNHDPATDKVCSYFNLRAIPAQPITLPDLTAPETAANCRYALRYRMQGSQVIGIFSYPSIYCGVYAKPGGYLVAYYSHGYAAAAWAPDTVGWADWPLAYNGNAIDGEASPPTDWEFLIRIETGTGATSSPVALGAVDLAVTDLGHALFMPSSAAP